MIIGTVLVTAALSLFIYNQLEDSKAGENSSIIVEKLEDEMPTVTEELPDPYDPTMTEVEVDGYKYIGYIILPTLDIKLPVMSDWSYPQLKIAPCRFSGSTKTDDLVIMAHNYKRHFKKLDKLSEGDTVLFTDMDGYTKKYTVILTEVLDGNAIEEMNAGYFDLTLFTCTYDGQSRITVRCSETE